MLDTLAFMAVLSGVLEPQTELNLSACWANYLQEREQAIVQEIQADLNFDYSLDLSSLQAEIATFALAPRVDYKYLSTLQTTEPGSEPVPTDEASNLSSTKPETTKTVTARSSSKTTSQSTVAPVSSDYRIIIPAIKVDAPVVETDIYDEVAWKADLLRGVGHYLADPGEGGKIFLTGHSSWWVTHPLGEVFRYLYKLQAGDEIYVDYGGKRYTYKVEKQEVVGPNTPSIVSNYGREELVLVTCYPYQSWKSRLVVYANKV